MARGGCPAAQATHFWGVENKGLLDIIRDVQNIQS